MSTIQPETFGCSEVERFIDAYLDGEFSSEESHELERHVRGCGPCERRLAFQVEFRSLLKSSAVRPQLPDGLRARIDHSLAALPAPSVFSQPRTEWQRFTWWATPAAAAAMLLGLLVWRLQPQTAPVTPVAMDAIAKYQRNLPMEVKGDEAAVRAWFSSKVGFAVKPPHMPSKMKLRGGRLATVRDRDAAFLIYESGEHLDGSDAINGRVAVLVFDPETVAFEAQARPHRQIRQIKNHDVYLDGQHGYNVAVFRDRDTGYALTSDMNEDQMIQLVSDAVSP